MNKSINTHESYRLLIEGELLSLVREAIALEAAYINSEEYSDHRQCLENKLYDLYQEIGWSVVYDLNQLPF